MLPRQNSGDHGFFGGRASSAKGDDNSMVLYMHCEQGILRAMSLTSAGHTLASIRTGDIDNIDNTAGAPLSTMHIPDVVIVKRRRTKLVVENDNYLEAVNHKCGNRLSTPSGNMYTCSDESQTKTNKTKFFESFSRLFLKCCNSPNHLIVSS